MTACLGFKAQADEVQDAGGHVVELAWGKLSGWAVLPPRAIEERSQAVVEEVKESRERGIAGALTVDDQLRITVRQYAKRTSEAEKGNGEAWGLIGRGGGAQFLDLARWEGQASSNADAHDLIVRGAQFAHGLSIWHDLFEQADRLEEFVAVAFFEKILR